MQVLGDKRYEKHLANIGFCANFAAETLER